MRPVFPRCLRQFPTWPEAQIHVKHCTANSTGRVEVILKFGRFEGWNISDVPADYLSFLISSSHETIAVCQTELQRRLKVLDE